MASRFFHKFKVREFVDFATDVVKYLALMHVTTTQFVNATYCVGPSMEPTIREEGCLVLIDLFSYKMRDKEYKTGDIVVAVCPNDHNKSKCYIGVI